MPPKPSAPFTGEATVAAALKKLAVPLGKEPQLLVDPALVQESKEITDKSLGNVLDIVAAELENLAKDAPDVVKVSGADVGRIDLRATASTASSASLDAESKTLTLHLPSYPSARVDQGTVRETLLRHYELSIAKTYAGKKAKDVPEAEYETFFKFLSAPSVPLVPKSADDLGSDPEASRIAEGTDLLARVKDDALKTKLRSWLATQGLSYFARVYSSHGSLLERVSASSEFRRAERLWTNWLGASLPELSAAERLRVAQALFERSGPEEKKRTGKSYPAYAFPGIDRFAFGSAVADEWIKAGHPATVADDRDKSNLFAFVVCPKAPGASPLCDYGWYRFAADQGELGKSLAQLIIARGDEPLLDASLEGAFRAGGSSALMSLWGGLASAEKVWLQALDKIIKNFPDGDPASYFSAIAPHYTTKPALRGKFLYLLARTDRQGGGAIEWARFPKHFKSALTEADFRAFLEAAGPDGVPLSWVVWGGLSKGWSRTAVLVPRLNAFATDKALREKDRDEPWKTLQQIGVRVCKEQIEADVKQLNDFFSAQASRPGDDAANFERLASGTRPDVCRKAVPAPPPPPKKRRLRR